MGATHGDRECGCAEAYLGEHRLDDGHEDVEGDGKRGAVLHDPLRKVLVVGVIGTLERGGLVHLLASHCSKSCGDGQGGKNAAERGGTNQGWEGKGRAGRGTHRSSKAQWIEGCQIQPAYKKTAARAPGPALPRHRGSGGWQNRAECVNASPNATLPSRRAARFPLVRWTNAVLPQSLPRSCRQRIAVAWLHAPVVPRLCPARRRRPRSARLWRRRPSRATPRSSWPRAWRASCWAEGCRWARSPPAGCGAT